MSIIHIKQIRDMHGERKNVARSKSCDRLLTCLFAMMLCTDRLGNLSGVRLITPFPTTMDHYGCAFKGNAIKRLRVRDILNYDDSLDERTVFAHI